jgi:hypothetical protein
VSEFLALLLASLRGAVRARSDLVEENLILRHQLVVGAPALSAHDTSSGDCTRSTTAPREAGQHFAVLQGGGSAGYRLA